MHKKLLCDTSGYFRAALCGSFQEAQTQTIDLPEDDAEVFCYFQYWAYTGAIEHAPRHRLETPWRTVARLYVFAEARCIPGLQNGAMDVLICKHQAAARAPVHEYGYIYDNTAERSPVRRFLAEWAAHRGELNKGWFEDRSIYPVDFTIDLALALYEKINGDRFFSLSSSSFWEDRARYHVEVAGASVSEEYDWRT